MVDLPTLNYRHGFHHCLCADIVASFFLADLSQLVQYREAAEQQDGIIFGNA